MHADFFTRGGVVGPPKGEGEFGRHIISTHGEEKIWRRTGSTFLCNERLLGLENLVILQVWGMVHNKSHLAWRARYSLKSLKTYTPNTCSYFKVH